jgi:hypothetical protein
MVTKHGLRVLKIIRRPERGERRRRFRNLHNEGFITRILRQII